MAWRRTRVVLGALVAVAVALILIDMRGPGPVDALRGVGGAIAGPPERALAWVRAQATDRLGGTAADRARIAELEDELERTRARAAAAAATSCSELALVRRVGWSSVSNSAQTTWRPSRSRIVARMSLGVSRVSAR